MILEIELKKSVCEIPFGASRQLVREKFGIDYREFKKSRFSKNTTDAYSSFHVFYSTENTFEAIEVFPTAKILVSGKEISWSYDDAKTWLLQLAPDTVVTKDALTSAKNGISIYAPDYIVESMLIALPGYFE